MTEGPNLRARPAFPPQLWWSRRALALHTTLIIVLPLFTWAFVWQVNRVRQGNELSWAYVFEWPFFAAYAVYLWWRLLHDQAQRPTQEAELSIPPDAEPRGAMDTMASEARVSDDLSDEDEELAAYNRYLAELNASGRRKHW